MAFAKIVQDGTTLIDLTQDTVAAENMLSGITAHKNDGTSITGTIQQKTAADITVASGVASIPAGVYPQTTKTVVSGTRTITTSDDAQTDIDVTDKANVNITGIKVPNNKTLSVTVPNGNSTATFTFNVDTSGNVTITES